MARGKRSTCWAHRHSRPSGATSASPGPASTHTWNTTSVIDLDHGGRIADARTPDEHVLGALARTPDPRLAAVTDPHPADRRLRAQIAEHLAVLNSGPPDGTRDLGRALEALENAERKQTDARGRLADVERQRDELGPSLSSASTDAPSGAGSTRTPEQPPTG